MSADIVSKSFKNTEITLNSYGSEDWMFICYNQEELMK